MNPNVRCKVACEWLDGGVTLRYSESRDWSSEEDALDYAAGCHRSGKYSSIRVRYSRKRMGRWQNAGSVAYPPNDQAQRLAEKTKTYEH